MSLEIIGAESLGVRSLCCLVTLADRRIVIDPGIALGYWRHGLMPHPLQIATGSRIRERIVQVLNNATDVVFSHFHGDHVPLKKANPYQLSIQALPPEFTQLQCWSMSDTDVSLEMKKRYHDLLELMGNRMRIAEGLSDGPLTFSPRVPHGRADSKMGSVMMTRIDMGQQVFVHASDIQLLDDATVDRVLDWQPDILLAAGPPLYLGRLLKADRQRARENALRLAKNIDVVILDHHLMRSQEGANWLDELSAIAGKKLYCAADFMGRKRCLMEAQRPQQYEQMPVQGGWHDLYAKGRIDLDAYLNGIGADYTCP